MIEPLTAEQQKIVEENLPLVKFFAKEFNGIALPFEDRIQAGTIGLMKAVVDFDTDRDTELSTYAKGWIRCEIMRENAKFSLIWVPEYQRCNSKNPCAIRSKERHKDKALSALRVEYIESDDVLARKYDQHADVDSRDQIDAILDAIDSLSGVMRQSDIDILRSRLLDGKDFREIGREQEICRETASARYKRAIAIVRSLSAIQRIAS